MLKVGPLHAVHDCVTIVHIKLHNHRGGGSSSVGHHSRTGTPGQVAVSDRQQDASVILLRPRLVWADGWVSGQCACSQALADSLEWLNMFCLHSPPGRHSLAACDRQ